jgi:hypothetical protein
MGEINDCGDPSKSGRPRAREEILKTHGSHEWLQEMNMNIDESGQYDHSTGINPVIRLHKLLRLPNANNPFVFDHEVCPLYPSG